MASLCRNRLNGLHIVVTHKLPNNNVEKIYKKTAAHFLCGSRPKHYFILGSLYNIKDISLYAVNII